MGHAATLGSDPSSTKDKYSDSHYAQPISSAGLSALKQHFTQNNPYPITKDTRLAYACEQSYIIDPTGFCVQQIGQIADGMMRLCEHICAIYELRVVMIYDSFQ